VTLRHIQAVFHFWSYLKARVLNTNLDFKYFLALPQKSLPIKKGILNLSEEGAILTQMANYHTFPHFRNPLPKKGDFVLLKG
jgi:hypothetical protein